MERDAQRAEAVAAALAGAGRAAAGSGGAFGRALYEAGEPGAAREGLEYDPATMTFAPATRRADRPASQAPEETPEPVSEGEAYFLSKEWQDPGRAIAATVRRRLAPTGEKLRAAWAAEGRGPSVLDFVADAANWAEVADAARGSVYRRMTVPLRRDGSAGAGPATPSPGCARLERVLRDYLEEPEQWAQREWPRDSIRSKPLLCVDVDLAADGGRGAVVLSTPSFSGEYAVGEQDFQEKLVARGGKKAVPFLLAGVLPLLPAAAKGAFVLTFADLGPTQCPEEYLQQLFHANGTPFLLHAAVAWTPWVGGFPDYDTIRGQSDDKIRKILDAQREKPVPWAAKRDQVLFRGGPHGRGDELYEGRFDDDELLALLPTAGKDPELVAAMLRCASNLQRAELGVWANSPRTGIRGRLDVQLTRFSNAETFKIPSQPCYGLDAVELGLQAPADVEYIPDTEWGAYRAVFVVDGFGAAFSFRIKLALDAVVLKMESPLKQEFERFLLPGVHYLPFTMRNATEAVEYALAEENAAEVRAMVRRAHRALAERMGLEHVARRVRDDLVRLWGLAEEEGAAATK